jgi:hypothetical protein
MLYKIYSKRGCKFLPHDNKGSHKTSNFKQASKSNVQSLIDLSVDIMSHQLKGIKNGRQDLQ